MPTRLKPTVTVTLDAEQVQQLQQIKDAEGIPVSVQVRMAVRAWLEARQTKALKTTRKREAARRRS